MMTKDKRERPVFRPDAARQLLEGGGQDLTDDERALLLAFVGVDADREDLDEEQRAVLDKLMAQMEGYDTEKLAQAVKHVVTAKSREGRKLEWPELKRGRKVQGRDKPHSSGE